MSNEIALVDASLSVFDALLQARRTYGPKREIIEDHERKPLDYDTFIMGSIALSQLLKRHIGSGERIGIMLPSSVGGAICFYSLHALGRVPVMINFTAGLNNIRSAIDTARSKTVITSRRFIQNAKLEDLVEGMTEFCTIIYLDDIRPQLSLSDKAFGFMASKFPAIFLPKKKPEDIAVILFTSGSFGLPRGVVLTHSNLIANTNQIVRHIHLRANWVLFCPLPIFHSMGMIAGVILPLICGLKSFLYPSPLHLKQIPPLIKDTKADLFFSTDTFLNQYAKVCDKSDFSELKFVVCGAEKVRDETRKLFDREFGGLNIVEGYGVTEASPVVALNDPDNNKSGTVGRLLPEMQTRLDSIEGIPVGGRLFIRGPNVMAGYIDPQSPDLIEAPQGGWHDTGDIVNIDENGYVYILGRAKRFAKIAGEMISLTAVEILAEGLWPDNRHAVVSVNDSIKGERLVIFTDYSGADLESLGGWAKKTGTPNIAVPKKIFKLEMVPVLGSGKTDYQALQRLAEIEMSQSRMIA